MRRNEREDRDLSQIKNVIESCLVCRLALCRDDRPYVVPMNFGYELEGDRLTLYLHCAKAGRKMDLLRQNPRVCFEMDRDYGFVTGPRPCSYTMKYQSIIGEGTAEVITDPEGIKRGLDVLMRRFPAPPSSEYEPRHLQNMAVIRVCAESYSCKVNL